MSNAAAALSATLADEIARCGVRDVIVAPGSRSTPLALAFDAHPSLTVHIVLDERSAGFIALGIARASGVPAVVVTTSGTAAVELHPAVVEAHHSQVPLVVCTADRPAELQGVGAPQTVDQVHLFGRAVRWFGDLGTAATSTRAAWRSFAARAVAEATGVPRGPVQLNIGFREPLLGQVGADDLPAGRPAGTPWHRRIGADRSVPAPFAASLAQRWAAKRGVIVAGAGVDDPHAVVALAGALGWPVLADPRSGCRTVHPCVVAHADSILRAAPFATWAAPQVVVRLGGPPASKVVATWLAAADAERVGVDPAGSWWDPERQFDIVVESEIAPFCAAVGAGLAPRAGSPGLANPPSGGPVAGGPIAGDPISGGLVPSGWLDGWRRADDAAAAALAAEFRAMELPPGQLEEPYVAARLAATVGMDEPLVVSSSMPVRDVEWYAPRRDGLVVHANRGANGIDGVVSTAIGVAIASFPRPTWLLIGDLAFLHDANALLWSASRPMRLRTVVVDNDGGGIFSFLPQAGVLAPAVFERLFGTAHGCDLAALSQLFGADTRRATDTGGLRAGLQWLAAHQGPAAVLVAHTDRSANVASHDRIHARIIDQVNDGLAPLGSARPRA